MTKAKSVKQVDRKSKPVAKSATRSLKDLSARDGAKVKGGAGRRIVPCI
ncbi:MAG: hypothetical protein U0Q55_21335 [Vicinamibacterales bacterium]